MFHCACVNVCVVQVKGTERTALERVLRADVERRMLMKEEKRLQKLSGWFLSE